MKRIFALLLLLAPVSAWACSACYGQSDSPLAAGMNWGILSLLGMIGSVLAGVAGFFVYLARRSARLAASSTCRGTPQSRSSELTDHQPQTV